MTDKSPNEELALLGSQICVNNAGNSVSFYSDVYVGNDVTVNTLITENSLMVGGNTIVTPSGIYLKTVFANNAKGSASQVLTANATGGVYWSNVSSGSIRNINQSFVGDGTTKTFEITGGYTQNDLNVFLNGVRMSSDIEVDVSSGTDIVFVNAPENKMPIDVVGVISASSDVNVNTAAQYTWTNTHTFDANVRLDGVLANGVIGTAGQFLTTDGSKVYWSTGGGGSVNTDAQYTWTNNHTFNANVRLNGLIANGTIGTAGQYLTTDGTKVYWSTVVGVNTATQYTWTNNHIFNANVRLNGLLANNTIGNPGQFLTSDGSKVYWSTSTINTAAQYAWTNTHSFTAPNGIAFNNTDTTNGYVRVTGTNFALVSQFVNGTGIGGWFSYPDRTNIGTKDCQFIVTTAAEGYLIKYDSSNNILRNFKFPTSNGIAGQVLTTDGFGVTSWVNGGGGGSVNTAAQYTWTNTHNFNANAIYFNNSKVIIGGATVPNITLGNAVGWYVDASNTFSAIGTAKSTIILDNPASSPGKVTIGSGLVPTGFEVIGGKTIINNTETYPMLINGSANAMITQSVGGTAVGSWFSFPSYTAIGTARGYIQFLTGSGTGAVSVLSGGVNFTFPPSTGSSGQVLSTDGAGRTSWTSAGGGGTAPGNKGPITVTTDASWSLNSGVVQNTNLAGGITSDKLSSGAPTWNASGLTVGSANVYLGSTNFSVYSYSPASWAALGATGKYVYLDGTTGNFHAPGGQFVPASDKKLKTNIKSIEQQEAIDWVRQINGVSYNKIDDENGPRQIGFIANEIEQLIPEVVYDVGIKLETGTPEMVKGLCYDALIPVLWQAVKYLDIKTKKAEEENLLIKQKMEDLENRLSALEPKYKTKK